MTQCKAQKILGFGAGAELVTGAEVAQTNEFGRVEKVPRTEAPHPAERRDGLSQGGGATTCDVSRPRAAAW